MGMYAELKRNAQEIRDEVKIGGNTAYRVGKELMDIVDELQKVDNREAENASAFSANLLLENERALSEEKKLDDKKADKQEVEKEIQTLSAKDAELSAKVEELEQKSVKYEDIVQNTGDSENEVMSQAAVTRELTELESESDALWRQKILNKWVSVDNVDTMDDNFDIYEYALPSEEIQLKMLLAVGGGAATIVDANGNVLWSYQGDSYIDYGMRAFNITKPQNGITLRATHAKKTSSILPKVMSNKLRPTTDINAMFSIRDSLYISSIVFSLQILADNSIEVKFSKLSFNLISREGSTNIPTESSYIIPKFHQLSINLKTKTLEVTSYLSLTDDVILVFNEDGVPSYGLLADYYNTLQIQGFNKVSEDFNLNLLDVLPSNVINNSWVSNANEIKPDSLFDVYEYDLSNPETKATRLLMYFATGGGQAVIVDADGNVLWSQQTKGGTTISRDDRYASQWVSLDIMENAAKLRITQVKWAESYRYAFPIRVLMDNQNPQSIKQESGSPLKDKKVLFIGDSITDVGYYVDEIANRTRCIVYNRGFSGSTLADGFNSMCDRLDMEASDSQNTSAKHNGFPTDADYVFILAGINDWGRLRSQIFGDFKEPITKSTFCGALKYMYRGLKLRYPNAKIYALNLLHTYSPDKFSDWNELNYSDDDETKSITLAVNNVGKSMYDYRDAISTCAKMYGIPVIDLFYVGFSAILDQDRARYYEDGLHPSAEGGKLMADYILKNL